MRYRAKPWAIGSLVLIGVMTLTSGAVYARNPASGTQTPMTRKPVLGVKSAAKNAGVPDRTVYPLTRIDQAGHKVILRKRPVHIASTTEGTDEILAALVPKREVAMVTSYASQPGYSNVVRWAKGIPALQTANAEAVIAVHPDLVLAASYTTAGVVRQIEQTGIPVYEFTDFNSIPGIEKNIRTVGELVDRTRKANQIVSRMNRMLRSIKNAVKSEKKMTVLDYSSYGYVAGNSTTVNDVIVDAGGINAAAAVHGWQEVTPEEIVKMNPQVIIDANTDRGFLKRMMHNPKLQTVSAVKHHRVYLVNGADLSSVSEYVVNGVRDVAHVLYPSLRFPQRMRPQ